MNNSTPDTIKENEFNAKVKGWVITTRATMASNIPFGDAEDATRRKEQHLLPSLDYKLNTYYGAINRIRYRFSRHGVFVHYGVGRGYIRSGNSVIRGSHNPKAIVNVRTGFNRKPVDWFDGPLKNKFPQLADITQEYYGDKALERLLSMIERATITKKI